eukprot:TRINITY_DN1038_c0_g1_i2.p1 TRINITY_DN1038_c0_g1~~TRINITY_DN1038_c0_g1_i2.p1  ORF type:complete len:526 (-),score=181.84 TRINITY_DN1038_c0_g1_i2:35-1612(-)
MQPMERQTSMTTEKRRQSQFDLAMPAPLSSASQVDPSILRRDARMFQPCPSSETTIFAIRTSGYGERKVWDANAALSRDGLFRLKVARLPELPTMKRQKSGDSTALPSQPPVDDSLFDTSKLEFDHTSGVYSFPVAPGGPLSVNPVSLMAKPSNRAEKYYQALLKAEHLRKEETKKKNYESFTAQAQKAARHALKAVLDAEVKQEEYNAYGVDQDSEDDDDEKEEQEEEEEEEEESDGEVGPLIPFDGHMKIELEIVVLRAPGEELKSQESDDGDDAAAADTRTPTAAASEEDSPRLDLADELAALQEELQSAGESSEDSGGLPEGLVLADNGDNIYSHDDPRLALGIAGTVFFVPEAERYSLAPSLPPPPPPSMLGRRRIRMKPRLPLEISNNRYYDEKPNIWPPAKGYKPPELEDRRRFEQTICTHDFYAAATAAFAQLPKPKGLKDYRKQRKAFGDIIDDHIRKSYAWRNKLHREYLIRKKKEEDEEKAEEDAKRAAQLKSEEERDEAAAGGGDDAVVASTG